MARVHAYVSQAIEELHDARWWAEDVPSEKEWVINLIRRSIANLHQITNMTKWRT